MKEAISVYEMMVNLMGPEHRLTLNESPSYFFHYARLGNPFDS